MRIVFHRKKKKDRKRKIKDNTFEYSIHAKSLQKKKLSGITVKKVGRCKTRNEHNYIEIISNM